MKKFVAMLSAAAIIMSVSTAAVGADKEKGEPDVYVDGSKIVFADQNALIKNDVTLVPARGVFEAMGNTVVWNGANRTVSVTSSTGVREIVLTIDSDVMKVSTFKSVFERVDEDVSLEVAATIINERTMIPLRAVAEAFDCSAEWDQESYAAYIKTGTPILMEGYTYQETPEEEKVKMSLSTDAENVGEGEEFFVYVDIENIVDNSYVGGVIATFEFDKEKFAYIEESGTLIDNDNEPFEASAAVENPNYMGIGAKSIFVTIDSAVAKTENGHILRVAFKKLTNDGGTIALANNYVAGRGYDSYLILSDTESSEISKYSAKKIVIDTAPVTVK